MSLCFLPAFEAKQKGEITEAEYVHHLLAHCAGAQHDGDDWHDMADLLRNRDPFGHSVRGWTLTIEPVKDTAPLEAVFGAYQAGDVKEVQVSLEKVDPEYPKCVRRSLAVRALQDRRASILKLCMDAHDAPYDSVFHDLANRVQWHNEYPDITDVLENSQYRTYMPFRKPYDPVEFEREWGGNAPPWVKFDYGGPDPIEW